MTFDWCAKERWHKTVKLCNVYMLKPITCNDIIGALNGLGLYEWERRMSYILSFAVLKAFERNEKTADITKMFSCELVSVDENGEHLKTQEEICEFLMEKLFKIVSENDDELIVSIKMQAFKN